MDNHPGVRFRPPDEADANTLLAIRLSCAAADGFDSLSTTEALPTADDLLAQIRTAAGAPERFVVAEAGGVVAGYGRINDWREGDGTNVWLHLGWVVPEHRGQGVGTALLHELEQRIARLAAATGGRWEYAANAADTQPDATQLLHDNGYAAGYTVVEMGLDWATFDEQPRPAALPPGLATRPARAEDMPAVARSVMEAYRDEYPDGRFMEPLDVAAYARDLLAPPHELALMQVAWQGEEPAGQVIAVIERGRAEIFEVSVRPAFRRHGLARALLTRALGDLRARGMDVVRLHTVAEFPTQAVRLYESLGFNTIKRFPRYRKLGS